MVGRHLEREVVVGELLVRELLERHLLERSVVVRELLVGQLLVGAFMERPVVVGELLERHVMERRELVVRGMVLMIRRFVRSLQRQRFSGWVAQRNAWDTRAWLARSWG